MPLRNVIKYFSIFLVRYDKYNKARNAVRNLLYIVAVMSDNPTPIHQKTYFNRADIALPLADDLMFGKLIFDRPIKAAMALRGSKVANSQCSEKFGQQNTVNKYIEIFDKKFWLIRLIISFILKKF